MSQSEKYTLLLMRDDSSVRRIRVGRGWLKFLLIFLLLIVVCGGLAIWLGSGLWVENRALQAEVRDLRLQNSLMLVRLDRLSTVERILQNTDPQEVNNLLSMISQQPGGAPESPAAGILPPVQPASPENGDAAGTDSNGDNANGATDEPDALNALLETIDEGRVRLENFLARPVQSDTQLELAYDMVNLNSAVRAEGRLRLAIMTKDNALYPLTLLPAASYYSMSSRKIVPRFVLPLPEQTRGGEAKALVVEMLLNDRLSLRRIYNLPVIPQE